MRSWLPLQIAVLCSCLCFGTAYAETDIASMQHAYSAADMKCSTWSRALGSLTAVGAIRPKILEATNAVADLFVKEMADDVRSRQSSTEKGNSLIMFAAIVFCSKVPDSLFGDAVIDSVGLLDGKGEDPLIHPRNDPPTILP